MIGKLKFKLAILLFRLANYLLKDKIQENRHKLEDEYANADWDSLNEFYDKANAYDWEKDYQEHLQSQSL